MTSICCMCLLSKQEANLQKDEYYENEHNETINEEVEDAISVEVQDQQLHESSTCGVHYSMIQTILSSLSEEVLNTATTADIIRDVVKTNSKLSEAKVSWHDLLKSEDAHDENGAPLYGKANAFISHTWRYRFKDTAESVIEYAQDFEQETGRQCYIWMDMFLLNQFSTDSFDADWLKETFTNVIKDINNTVVIMTPFESPASVKRVWCLWELYLSIQYSKLNIVLPPEQSIRFNDALLKDPYSVTEMYMQIGQIRAEEAEAFDPNDKDMIFAIIKETIGFKTLNSIVISTIKQWIEDQCQLKLDAINNGEIDAEEALAAPTKHQGSGSTLFRAITVGSVGLTKLSLLHPDVKYVINGTSDSWPPFANALTMGLCDIVDLIMDHPSFNFKRTHWQIDAYMIKEKSGHRNHPDFDPSVPHERVEQTLRKYFEKRFKAGFEEFLDYEDFVQKSKNGKLKKQYPAWAS